MTKWARGKKNRTLGRVEGSTIVLTVWEKRSKKISLKSFTVRKYIIMRSVSILLAVLPAASAFSSTYRANSVRNEMEYAESFHHRCLFLCGIDL